MKISWKDDIGLQGKKKIKIKVAKIKGHQNRFCLWQSSKVISMWSLWDKKTDTIHWIMREDAEPRIEEILAG